MSLALPWALLGLLALPLVWWLHRRLRRPPVVLLPSMMFLQDEADARSLPRGRRFDAELALALCAVALLALAAAGPQLLRSDARRILRVAVDVRQARPAARAYAQRVLATRKAMAAALAGADELLVVPVPALDGAALAPRPTSAALLSAARAGEASARFVITDDAPPTETGGVHWIALGDVRVANQGIVAVSVDADADATRVFCTLANYGGEPVRLALAAGWITLEGVREVRSPVLELEPEGMGSLTLQLPADLERISVRVTGPGGAAHSDAMSADDTLILQRRRLGVRIQGLGPLYGQRLRAALEAVLGRDGWREVRGGTAMDAHLAVVRRDGRLQRSAAWMLELDPLEEGAAAQRAAPGGDTLGRGEIARDLSTAGVDWVYAPGAAAVAEGERILLARGPWPVLLQRGSRVRLAPDPLRGEPRPVDTPFWPLLIQNLVEAAVGRGVGGGYRAQGLLDAASSRPGRVSIPFDPAVLSAAAPSVQARVLALRSLLIAAALACLGLLWAAPRLRRRLTRRRVAILGPAA